MKTNHRVWIEIVTLGSAIAFALALLLATLGAAAGAATGDLGFLQAAPAATEQTYEGMVSCSKCGARHAAALDQTAADCVRICVHGGSSFALVSADETYLLDGDLNILKKISGQRARIVGALNGKTIKISSAVAET